MEGQAVDAPAAQPKAPEARPTTVLYVLSSPHSGSTVLGVILSGHPDIVCGGELNEVPEPAWVPGRACSCRAPTGECAFWSEVRRRYESEVDLGAFRAAQKRFERWRNLPTVLFSLVWPRKAAKTHAGRLALLARTISETSGKHVVVDTSKLAARGLAYLVGRNDSVDVRFLHVVRDSRGVVASRRASIRRERGEGGAPPDLVPRFSLLWVLANLAYEVLFSIRPDRYLRIRYEDFVKDPGGTLLKIERLIGVDLGVVRSRIEANGSFPVEHLVAGNRLRLKGEVRLRPESGEWKSSLSASEQRTVRQLTAPMAFRYGYSTAAPVGSPPAPAMAPG